MVLPISPKLVSKAFRQAYLEQRQKERAGKKFKNYTAEVVFRLGGQERALKIAVPEYEGKYLSNEICRSITAKLLGGPSL